MKKIYYILIVAIFAVVSCVKEQPAEEITESEQVSVVGLIQTPEDFITKTDYDTSSGTQAIFSWKGEEKISLMKQTGLNTNLTHELYSGTATDGSPEMTFKGASLDYDTGYALYPARDATTYGNARFDWYSDYANKRLYLWMGESLTYNSGAPLSNIVPMVGKLTGGEYVFNVVSGILDVQIKHMPSTANKVRIESNSHNLSLVGFRNSTSNIGMVDELEAIYTGGLKLDQNNASAIDTEVKTKTYSFTAGLDYNTTYHFYFPIPAGALNNGTTDTFTIKILQDNTLLCEKTTSSAITITNGHITPLRPLVPGATVSISGSSNDPKLNYTRDLGNDAVLHVHISNSETEITNPQSVYRPTNRYSNTSESQSLNGLLDQNGNEKLLTTSGKYYLHYYVDKSASNNISDLPTSLSKVITHGVVPFYFLSATDKNAYTGQYQMTYTSGSTTLTLQTSDDASKGNIMLTEFAGLTGKLYTTYPHETDAFTDANLVFAGTWEIASLGGHYIYSADNADGSNFKNAIWLNLGADTSADANFDNKNWTLTSESHYLIDEGNTLVSYAFLRGNVSRDTYTVVGNESVFHSNWDVNDSDNNLRYDPSIDQYSKDFTVPGDVSSFEFKIVKNHAYANGEWPASNNYVVNDITANGYSKTLTIVFNPNTNSITHSYVQNTSNYSLYVLPEIVDNLASSWGTSYTMWGAIDSQTGYDFQKLDDVTFGSYTYSCFAIPDALIDGNSHDVVFKGASGDEGYCEVLIDDITFDPNVNAYYYRTDGLNLVSVSNASSPALLPTGNKIWICVYAATGMGLHMHSGTADATTWDNLPVMTQSTCSAKLWGKNWFYLDLTSYAGRTSEFTARIKYNNDANYSKQTTDIAIYSGNVASPFSLDQSLYFYTTTWSGDSINWQRLEDPTN